MDAGRIERALDRRAQRLRCAVARSVRPTRVIEVELRSPAGHALPCRLHTPRGRGPWRGVLLVPGGLDGARSTEADTAVVPAAYLARRGLAVLTFTPSGREGAPGHNDRNGPLHQDECAAALTALLARPEVADAVVLSLSFGVVLAAGALTRHPALAERVVELIDWEGPGSRRWFEGVKIGEDSSNDAFWGPREAVAMAPALRCPYRRFQSTWDHVHGPNTEIGAEMARAAHSGASPRARLMDREGPFDDVGEVVWGPPTVSAQAALLSRWIREA